MKESPKKKTVKEKKPPVPSPPPGTEELFERIGTTYYKLVRQPNAAGQLIERSIPWTIEAILRNHLDRYEDKVEEWRKL